VGRLIKWKDPATLLKGFKIVTEKLPDARLEIVGNGPLKGKLEAISRSFSLESTVRLMPGSEDISYYLKRAWVFAISSIREASPNVILEAMASSLPVVASRVGGIPELVQDGQTGMITEPGDPQGFADALINLLNNEQLRREMGRRARQRVLDRYSVEDMTRQTEKILLEATNENVLHAKRFRRR
jgi:glycosyltransferase involved in cell wall biosynthesis